MAIGQWFNICFFMLNFFVLLPPFLKINLIINFKKKLKNEISIY